MTLQARLNLQKGVPEDKRFPATTYNVECPLDLYLIQKQEMHNRYVLQSQREDIEHLRKKTIEDATKEITKQLSSLGTIKMNSTIKL